MTRSAAALAILLSVPAWAAPAPLTTLRAVHALTAAEASQGLQTAFEGTVIYYDDKGIDLFVQDGDLALYVFTKAGLHLVPGDRVLIQGKTHQDFRPDVVSDEVILLHHGPAPAPVDATFAQLIRAELDCRRVKVRAQVRSADIVRDGDQTSIYLHLVMDGGYIAASVVGADASVLNDWLDATVEITGAVAGKFDSKMQLTGIVLEVQGLPDVSILNRAPASPQSLPITPMDAILQGYDVHDKTQRVRVRGVITYYQPGTALVLQDGAKSLWVMTQFEGPLRIGDVVDATGFPDVVNDYLTLGRSEIHPTHLQAPVLPLAVDWGQLAPGKHAFDLVSVEGRVLAAVRAAAQDEYILESEGHLFSAIYQHPDQDTASLPPMKPAPIGSQVRVTGICTLQYGSDPLGAPVAFEILLRSFADISVIARPSLLSVSNLVRLVSVLFLLVVAAGIWGWTMQRRAQRQTAAMAKRVEAEAILERRRSHILEDINAGRPLAEILHQITSLVSFNLNGALCWCQIADGARLGSVPSATETQTILRQEIPSRSGPLHGELFAAFDAGAAPPANAQDALSMGAWLATLAVETRGLYSDLLHRSEFDLLTDIHNRFSLDKQLQIAIEEAHQQARVFGLIYIDLDDFKQVNDRYGHQVGDQYLQEAALRMKRQLRPGDMLARLGGDEFAVLVPSVRGRAEVEEIASRLERSFSEPFAADGHPLQGTASVGIALYPEDGATRDTLLNVADAAMYAAKQAKRTIAETPAG
jgi:diguanylate cyclase (GGDEF)-like protein